MDNNTENKKTNSKPGGAKTGEVVDPVLKDVLAKIDDAESVLVALSNDPTVDEIAAAMGLSMALDNIGKRVTAIYSGKTPNVLEFLNPQDRFETGTESLQDFVIALNKDKADHLRYKIDGDFVKVYVTPYKSTISGNDIEFSRGDFNVDLVISLNVSAETEFDAALKEHGRIMHDATTINISNGVAGKFGDVEWCDENASSISEMVSKLAFSLGGEVDPPTATALLTGLVAATDRFSNQSTTPEVMVIAAKLMGAGADQQLVVQNVQGEVVFNDDQPSEEETVEEVAPKEPEDATKLEINHDVESEAEESTDTDEEPELKLAGQDSSVEDDSTELAGAQEQVAADENEGEVESAVPPELPKIVPDKPLDEGSSSVNDSVSEETPDNLAGTAPVEPETPATSGVPETPALAEPAVAASADSVAPTEPETVAASETPAVAEMPVGAETSDTEAGSGVTSNTEDDPVKAAMEAALGTATGSSVASGETIAGVTVSGADNAGDYAGGSLADQMVSNIEKNNSNVGATDYGKMIDDALNEPLPGEGGIQVGENGPNGPQANVQDVDAVAGPAGNPMAAMERNDEPVSADDEQAAMDIIKQAKSESETSNLGLGTDGELPKIVPGGSSFGGGTSTVGEDEMTSPDLNPAMSNAPGIGQSLEGGDVPDMNFGTGNTVGLIGDDASTSSAGNMPGADATASGVPGGLPNVTPEPNPMPMPGQEMAPPPVLPAPDFGSMPPIETKVENTIPAPSPEPAPAAEPSVRVGVDEGLASTATISPSGIPQMPAVGGVPSPLDANMSNENVGMQTGVGNFQSNQQIADSMNGPSDPSAFKIPGIHT